VIDETADHAPGYIHNIPEYLELRRLTIGGYPSFLCFELGLDIPDEVMEHPKLKSLLGLVAETVVLTNVSKTHVNEDTFHLTYMIRTCTHTMLSRQGETTTIFSLLL
jgi:hypothetical protein